MNNASHACCSNPRIGEPSGRFPDATARTFPRHVGAARLMILLALGGACDHRKGPGQDDDADPAGVGLMSLALTTDGDFAGIQFQVVPADGGPALTRYVASRALGGALSADAFFTLRPGQYSTTATVMDGPGTAAPECSPASGTAVVRKGSTTELMLMAHCRSTGFGGLDINVGVQHEPEITSITFDPSKFVSPCETAAIAVSAVDPGGAPLSYRFKIVNAPGGVMYRLDVEGARASFRAMGAGDFSLAIAACTAAGCADITVPLHVVASGTDATCAVSCDDGNPCTADAVGDDGACHSLAANEGVACGEATSCSGQPVCHEGQCLPGAPVICEPGLTCGTDGCQNVNECDNGQNNCSPNALCTDHDPRNDDVPFSCNCQAGYEGDGVSCAPICDPLTVATGVERCVRARPDGTVDMHLSRVDPAPWEQQYVQANEPHVNFCGPTAAKNFLYWYGVDAPYATLAAEMRTNSWDNSFLVAGALLAAVATPVIGPLVGCAEPISCAILAAAISTYLVDAGTLPGDMQKSLNGRAPAGYVACEKDGDSSEEPLRAALAGGNPVVFLESTVGNLHWATATGIYTDGLGRHVVRVANSTDRPWADFRQDWSLSRIGEPARTALNLAFSIRPYTMIRWIRAEDFISGHCP
jgi:hypothetical protein